MIKNLLLIMFTIFILKEYYDTRRKKTKTKRIL